MKTSSNVWPWILTIFFALAFFVYFPSFSCVFSLLVVILLLPVAQWQDIVQKYIHGKIKTIAAVVLILLAIFTAPTKETSTNHSTTSIDTTSTTISTIASTDTTPTLDTTPTTEVVPTSLPQQASSPTVDATTNTNTNAVEETKPTPSESNPAASSTSATEAPHTHDFAAATCTSPKTCSCGVTEGKAVGHQWKDATCSEPKTCSVCNETSGKTAGHKFSKGKCTTCGKDDPDYEEETMVWIPKSGTKYHSRASCSGMKDPKEITKSKAESKGYTPCAKCN